MADHRVAVRGVPGRWLAAGPVEPLAQRAHQHPVQQSVEDDLLARGVDGDLGGEEVAHGVGRAAGCDAQDVGQRIQQPPADLAPYRVGADDQRRGAVGSLQVGADVGAAVVPAEPVAGAALLGRRAVLAALDRLGLGPDLVDEGERRGTPHDHRVAGGDLLGRATLRDDPPGSLEDGAQRQRGAVHEQQRPGRRQGRTAEQRPLSSYTAEQITEGVHPREVRRIHRRSGFSPMDRPRRRRQNRHA